jgi:hypothetical protein
VAWIDPPSGLRAVMAEHFNLNDRAGVAFESSLRPMSPTRPIF